MALFVLPVLAALSGCPAKLDTAREPVDEGTFGETVFTLLCKRLAYTSDLADGDGRVDVRGDAYRAFCRAGGAPPPDAYAKVLALDAHRAALVAALDTVFPEAFLADVQAYVSSHDFLALYDDGRLENAVDALVRMLDLAEADPGLAPALARLEGRYGYRPLLTALGALRAVVKFDRLDAFLEKLVDAIAPGGAARGEFRRFQEAVARGLMDLEPLADPAAPDRTLRLALDLLLEESPFLGTERPMPLVLRDARGLAQVDPDPVTLELPAPFVDLDGDGLADADAQGRFVDATGMPFSAPTPFATPFLPDTAPARDPMGRALVFADGPTLYRYVDLDRTVLGALARELPRLLDPARGPGLDLLRGASAILGERVMATHTYGDGSTLEYRGYDTTTSPLLDLVYGYLLWLEDPNLSHTLSIARKLLADHEPVAARLLEAILAAADLGDLYPDARLEPQSALYDDLVPVLREILDVRDPATGRGLAEDLLRALENPAVQELPRRFARMMRYADPLHYDPDTQEILGTLGATPVDRTKPDSGYNRSLFQRILHLIADSSGVRLCNKQDARIEIFGIGVGQYDECELFQIDDLAIFYVQSIACAKDASGNCRTDDGSYMPKAYLDVNAGWLDPFITDNRMESLTGIEGFRSHPKPWALNRALFLNPPTDGIANLIDPVRCKDGDRFIDQHAGTLPVFELEGFFDQIRPIVQPFADWNREDLFVKLLVVLHRHWPSPESLQHQSTNPAGKGYVKRSNARSYEPLLIDLFENGDLWPALTEAAPVVGALTSAGGRNARRVIADAARYLVAPQPGLSKRTGETSTKTNDGAEVTPLSPWYVLADAYAQKRARLAETGGEGEAWERATGQVADMLLRADEVGGAFRFRNPRFRGLAVAFLDLVQARVEAHRASGDLSQWTRTDLAGRAQKILAGPVFAGAADFVLSLQATPEARTMLEALAAHLGSETPDEEVFRIVVTAAADLAQLFLDDPDTVPIAHFFGRVLLPEFDFVEPSLVFLQGARRADGEGVLARILRQLLDECVPGETALAEIVDALSEVHRVLPYAELERPLSEADYRSVFGAVADFFRDEKRGLARFIDVVKERHVR